MSSPSAPSLEQQRLVLIGGGHTHALVLRMLAKAPIAHTEVILISPDTLTAYSGMLPGLVAGHYTLNETHIDLAALCETTATRFIQAAVTQISPSQRSLTLSNGNTLAYDWLSIDIGATPALPDDAKRHGVTAVKPVADFYRRWQQLKQTSQPSNSGVNVVGGGAGGVEMVLAIAEQQRHAQHPQPLALYCRGALLAAFPHRVQRHAKHALAQYGVSLHEHTAVSTRPSGLFANEKKLTGEIFWCTGVQASAQLQHRDLACDAQGFICVKNTLQTQSDSRIFAAGDCASFPTPLPKAGVYAVRQAPLLAHNLRAAITGKPLRDYRPQHHFLSLLSLGEKRAVASRGRFFTLAGAWVWRWKDHIDRTFMAKFARRRLG